MSEKLKTILIFVSFLLIYFFIRSAQLDVAEAVCLEDGVLYCPNHFLGRIFANVAWNILQTAGYGGRSVYVFQLLNIFYGAVTVAIAYVAFQKLGANSWSAFAACILLGTSHIFWHQSTDAYYMIIAGMFSTAALLFAAILFQKPSMLNAFFLAVCFAFATLSWQALVLLFPIYLWPLRHRFKELMIFAVMSVLIIVSFYVGTGIAQGSSTTAEVIRWTTHYAGANLPAWGKFEIQRIPLALFSAIRSIQVYSLSIPQYLRYDMYFDAFKIAVGAICLLLLGISILFRAIQLSLQRNYKLVWLFSGYLCLVAFIAWWVPLDIKPFVVPNIFLCAIAALVFSSWKPTTFTKTLVFIPIGVMAFATFSMMIWPRHIYGGDNLRKAQCVQQNMSSRDAIITTDWNFNLELLYFYQIRSIEIIGSSTSFPNHDKLMDDVFSKVEQTKKEGGKIFIVDPKSYEQDYLQWLEEQSTFTRSDFDHFPGKFAFQCLDLKFREITAVQK